MNRYFQQQALFPPQIFQPPSLNLGMILVIPAREEPQLLSTLIGLTRCALPSCDVEVIVVCNGSETDGPEIRAQQEKVAFQVEEWAEKWPGKSRLRFFLLWHPDLPRKQAGVGLARKIGMDEACFRLEKAGNPRGLVVCYDADSRCDKNYLTELEAFFLCRPDCEACGIYFEHPLEGVDFPDGVYEAIAEYELHLRYFIQAQRFAGFPFAYHTVGSSMAVRSDAYQRQGGMNRRQAGEDFYFFHKFTPLGAVGTLTTTRVIPSPRPSHRVPFGTGRAVRERLNTKKSYRTYHPELFHHLKAFRSDVPALFEAKEHQVQTLFQNWHPSLQAFLEEQDFHANLQEIRSHSAKQDTFENRFFRWFNAFRLMKYLHHARENGFPDVPVGEAAEWLLGELKLRAEGSSIRELLLKYREIERKVFSS